jgi:glutamate N-acetyltransferase/amino-acid N-acetyltransferase
VAKAVVNSPLVKTAVHGADPNWGRVAMAIGKCSDDVDIEPGRTSIAIGGVHVYPPAADAAALEAAAQHLTGDLARIDVDLGIADGCFRAIGCDLTDGYVRINADYTT